MVALSCAQGYAQVTGKPAAVIVHVDCGTQALAGAVHNVDRCRTPVSIAIGLTWMIGPRQLTEKSQYHSGFPYCILDCFVHLLQ